MKYLMIIFGCIWAILGVLNIVLMETSSMSESGILFSVILNVMIFIFPGLLIYAAGNNLKKK